MDTLSELAEWTPCINITITIEGDFPLESYYFTHSVIIEVMTESIGLQLHCHDSG